MPGESLSIRKLTLLNASEHDDDDTAAALVRAAFRFKVRASGHQEERG